MKILFLLRYCGLALCTLLHIVPKAASSSESHWLSNTTSLHLATTAATTSTRSKLECAVKCHHSPPCRSYAWQASSSTCHLQVEVDSGMTSSVYLPVYLKQSKYMFY